MSLAEIKGSPLEKKTTVAPTTPTQTPAPALSKTLPTPIQKITQVAQQQAQQKQQIVQPIQPEPAPPRPTPTTPLEVLGIYTPEKYAQLPKVAAGRYFVTPQPPPGHTKDIITGTIIPTPQYQQQKPIDYTAWAKEVYGSPGYKQPGMQYTPFDKQLGYANAVIQAAFDPSYWQEQLFGQHKGVDIINKYLYESQHPEYIGASQDYKRFDYGQVSQYVLSRPLVSNVIVPTTIMTGAGVGLGALTKFAPAAGAIGKATLTGVGAYYVGQATIPPAIEGIQTGQWSGFQRNIIGLGIQVPFMGIGFSEGYNAISKVNIPTFTTKGITTIGKINTKLFIPIKTTMNRLNPMNIWVRAGAEKIAPEEFISKNVLEGSTRFPTSPNVKTTMKLFEKGYNPETGLYETVHARAYPMKGTEISAIPPERGTDVYGMYVSSKGEASPYFLRLGANIPDYTYTPVELSFLPKRPSFRTMFVESITRAPKTVRYTIESFKGWQFSAEPQSTAVITPAHEMGLKEEIEAVIPPGAEFRKAFEPTGFLQRTKGYGEYTTYMKRDIPIYKYNVVEEGGGSPEATKEFIRRANEDYGYISGNKTLYSPSMASLYFGFSSFLRSSNVTISSSIISSEISSYAPSKYIPSYKPSSYYIPSYKPSSYVPITPSYIPSKIKQPTSYIPSKIQPPSYYVPSKVKPPPYYIPSKIQPPYYPIGTPDIDLKHRKKTDKELFDWNRYFRKRVFKIGSIPRALGVTIVSSKRKRGGFAL